MAAITATEGRFLGGRPPYGFELEDVGPHPNPAKAADGKRLRRLVANPVTASVVKWIHAKFPDGWGIFAIAEELTRQGVPSPSATDRARNRHRDQVAWSKGAVRVVLTNPRYTGRQVWNKQRKDEVLLDVNDVALGTTTMLRWNEKKDWIWSESKVHDALVTVEDFERVQAVLAERGRGSAVHKPHRTRRPYIFRGVLFCGYCERRMQGNWNNKQAYYRCRYPQEYALVNEIDHPKVVYLREAEIVGAIDEWLVSAFGPGRAAQTIEALTQVSTDPQHAAQVELSKKTAECDRKLSGYRAALDAGGDPIEISGWINEEKRKLTRLDQEMKAMPRSGRLDSREIGELIERIGDLVTAVNQAEPDDKAELYRELGLKMVYRPQEQVVEARLVPDPHMCKWFVSEDGHIRLTQPAITLTTAFLLP